MPFMDSTTVNIHEAKTHFSKLLNKVQQGEDVIIAKAGKPIVRLVPVTAPAGQRVAGSAQDQIIIADDFDAPLPEEILKDFES